MSSESQWVTYRIGSETFGFEIQFVKEMLRMPEVYTVPHAATDNMGVMLLRSKIIPVFDLPKRFGLKSRKDDSGDLVLLLQARLQDHFNWIKELEASVNDRREFTLTTDPHACKFGLWYDAYQPQDNIMQRLLKSFDAPHQQIHAVGAQVKEHHERGEYEEAQKLVQTTRDATLQSLTQVFNDAIAEIQDYGRQGLIIVGTSACTIGVAVDEIHSVIKCQDEEIQPPDDMPGIEQFSGLIGVLPQKGMEKCIMLLDPAQIYPQLIPQMS
jgi:chemotaxis signal transduction protein